MDWLIKLLGGHTKEEHDAFMKREAEATRRHMVLIENDQRNHVADAINYLHYVVKQKLNSKIDEAVINLLYQIKETIDEESECASTIELFERLDAAVVGWREDAKKKTLAQYFEQIAKLHMNLAHIESNDDFKILSEPIENLNLDTRAYNALDRHGIQIIGEVIIIGIDSLRKINGIGSKSLDEISEAMNTIGFPLDVELPEEIMSAIKNYSEASSEVRALNFPKDFKPDLSSVLLSRGGLLQHSSFSEDNSCNV